MQNIDCTFLSNVLNLACRREFRKRTVSNILAYFFMLKFQNFITKWQKVSLAQVTPPIKGDSRARNLTKVLNRVSHLVGNL